MVKSDVAACMVNVDTASEPTALTEPVITPFDVFRDNPVGNEPEETEYVIVSPSASVAPHKSAAAIVSELLLPSKISKLVSAAFVNATARS